MGTSGQSLNAPEFDAVVVGASLAGSVAATLLGRAGARVALVERNPDPAAYKRVCTHLIQASGVPTLERLGLLELALALGAQRSRLNVWTRWGWIVPPPDAVEPALNLRREKLDPLVRAAALEAPGVEPFLGCAAESLLRERDGRVRGVVVRTRDGGETPLRARLVIGADGRGSRIAELSGVAKRIVPHGRFAYGMYCEGPSPARAPNASAWFLDPQWAAAFPTDGGLTFYAAMPTLDRLPEFRRDPERALRAFVADLPDPPPILESRRVGTVVGKLDMTNVRHDPVAPGLALVGDAAMAIDPLWGIGCGWALQSAEWLCDAVAAPLAAGPAEDAALARGLRAYRRRWRARLMPHVRMIEPYAGGRRNNVFERTLYAAAARDGEVAAAFEAVGARTQSPLKGLATVLPKVAAVNVRHVLSGRPRYAPYRGDGDGDGDGRAAARAGGTRTRLRAAGPQEAREAVVFVHGNPGSADDWETLVDAAGATGARAVAFDLPDFGETIAPPGFEHTVGGYAAFVEATLAVLGIDRVHLVAHDFGGPIALAWAAGRPDRLASATLIDTGILPGYRWHALARIWRTPVLGELFQASGTRTMFRWLVDRGEPRGLPRAFVDRMYDHFDTRTRRAVLKLYRATGNPGLGARELAALLAPLDLPALVIWGEHDGYISSSFAVRQRELFPSADVHVLPASGHWPFADAPETVERLLVAHLRAAGAGDAGDAGGADAAERETGSPTG